jgi:hypothetical protein
MDFEEAAEGRGRREEGDSADPEMKSGQTVRPVPKGQGTPTPTPHQPRGPIGG